LSNKNMAAMSNSLGLPTYNPLLLPQNKNIFILYFYFICTKIVLQEKIIPLWLYLPILQGNNSNKLLDRVVFSCQQNGVNTFYKRIEFQVNSFDSYWEILIIQKISQISMYYVETRAEQFNTRYEKVERPAPVGGALV
jgi:hypothetical protein